ncbi:MAG: BACON domain-containing carbohydrate-binding protein, partial [Bryobacteraceae bacterium]|nr:BACON domain-containing carbohydrate-binding protein [Bryobacteraceae bacterium]
LSPGGQRAFTANVAGTTDTRVVWSLLTAVGSISSTGVYTAPSSIAQTTAVTVKATSVADSSKSATAVVSVQTAVGLTVSPASTSVISGNTVQFGATVTGTADTRVSWTASAGNINSAGLFTAPAVTAATAVTITARSLADAAKTATARVTVNPVATAPGTGAWIESSGLLSIEAENGRVVNRSQSWIFRSNVAGYSGSGFMSVEPNSNTNATTSYTSWSPQVQFDVRFASAGIYYVWIRGYGETDSDDSIHIGLDGAIVPTSETISEFPRPAAWGWTNVAMDRVRRITLPVPTAGVHTINAFMREDGFRFDKIVLTTNSGYTPSGNGPAESARETGGASSPVLSLTTTSVVFTGVAGGSAPGEQSVGISNVGGGTLSWSAQSNQSWLSVSPASGSGNTQLKLNVATAGLAAGDRTAAVTVSAPGAGAAPQTINVTLRLTSSTPSTPTLTVNPSSLSFNATTGSGATTQNASISFSGGSLGWSASDDQSWLSVSPASGSGNGTLAVTVNPSGLAVGTYTGVITVLSAGATNSPDSVNVSLTVSNPAPITSSGRSFYVATNGSASNDGSISRPWDFTSAMKNTTAIRPGDTVWIRGGTYGTGVQDVSVKLVGTETAPIVVRAYPGEHVKMQHPLIVGCCNGTVNPSAGAYVWIWGLEFVSTVTDRTGCPSGPPCYASSTIRDAINAFAPGVKFINNIIHDAREGIAMWKEALNGEAYGNIIYNNGFHASDRGHGHGIYSQNRDGVKKFIDNILFNGFGYNFHMYGSGSTYVKNFLFEGNVAFNAGILEGANVRASNVIVAGGADGNRGIVLKDNHFYNSPDNLGYAEIGWQWSSGNGDVQATNNYFIGGRDAAGVFDYQSAVFTGNTLFTSANQVWLRAPFGTASYNWNNNKYYGSQNFRYGSTATSFSGWKSAARIDQSSTHNPGAPTGVWTFVRPNRCEAGRAHIVIYNWALQPSVAVDLSGVLSSGMRYEIRDAQNFFAGPIVSGTYNGGQISIPMTGLTVDAPNGSVPYIPVHTAPKFGTFVVVVPGSSSRTC